MFNREYHRRAARQALGRVGASLVLDDSHFYRPAKRVPPGIKVQQRNNAATQLELFAPARDHDRPLADIFPEAYE